MRLAALIPVLLVGLPGRVGSQNVGATATTVRGADCFSDGRSGDAGGRGGLDAQRSRPLCRPDVFLDGVRVRVDELFPMNLVTPMSFVRAAEVYAHSVPIEFASSRNCGAIVIWTGGRRGS
jgi:hypothetical protein